MYSSKFCKKKKKKLYKKTYPAISVSGANAYGAGI